MKAIVYTKYGPTEVLLPMEVAKPSPQPNQVLVKVYASSVNASDWRRFTLPWPLVRMMGGGLIKPKQVSLGVDVAGRIEAVGAAIKQFHPGDEVFGVASGAFAEYACAAENRIVLKPANISFEEAAAVPVAAMTALQGLRNKGNIQSGQKVLINGASGGVGMFSVQIAKFLRAEVTAVCSARNLDMARSVGADHTINYAIEDVTRNGQHYDLILGVNGYHPILAYWRSLNPGGTYVGLGGSMAQIFQGILLGPLLSKLGSKKIGVMLARSNQEDLIYLAKLLEEGKIIPVIDKRYPLGEAPQAIKYVIEEHPRGKVIITTER